LDELDRISPPGQIVLAGDDQWPSAVYFLKTTKQRLIITISGHSSLVVSRINAENRSWFA
jgi:hypothetical protein